jgi:NAD(P)H dehydrogenase (quinone)
MGISCLSVKYEIHRRIIMDKIKLAVIFYSSYGTNYKLAKWAQEGAEAAGAEVRVLKVPELIPEQVVNTNAGMKACVEMTKDIPIATSSDLEWADAYIFTTGTKFGNISSQMKNFFDMQGGLWAGGKLQDKVVSAMSSAQNPNGGQESTVKAIYGTMMHWGAIIAAPGYTDNSAFKAGGNPYGTSVTVGADGEMIEDVEDAVKHQAKRTVEVAVWIKKGQQ